MTYLSHEVMWVDLFCKTLLDTSARRRGPRWSSACWTSYTRGKYFSQSDTHRRYIVGSRIFPYIHCNFDL